MSPFIYSSLILLSIDIMTIIHGNVGTVIIGVECATSYSQVILCSKAAILHCIFWIITKYKVRIRGVQNNTCVTNPGGRTNSDRDRRRLFSISLINHKHSPLTFNGLLIQLLSIKYNLIAVPHLAAKSRRRLPGPESSLCSAVNQTINRVGRPVSWRRLPQPKWLDRAPSLYAVNVEGFPAGLNCPESSLNSSYNLIYC